MLSRLYKLVFDISVCYFLGAFLLYYVGGITLQVSGFLLLFITVFLSVLLKSRSKRKLSLLIMIVIPSFALVIGKPVFLEVVVYAFTWGYAFFVLFTERFITGRGEFLDRVRRTSVLCLILPVLMLTNLSTFGRAILVCGPYLITALVSAGFLLRELRIEPQMKQQKGYYRQQIGEM
ncbi:MAG: hypothetical protein K0R46_2514, partial [Herbinix sp.]|nr:hypothetical protein [Herbinix sp.]